MLQPAFLIAHQGGVARGALLRRYGLTRRMLATAVREGSVVRLRAGVFALPSTDQDIVEAAAHGGAVTCSRALRLHGVWTLSDDESVHVWLGGNGRLHHETCACVSHYFDGRTALGVAPLEDVLVHVYRCAGDEAFFAALESALNRRKISEIGRRRIRDRLPSSARWLIDLARTDADSGLESLLRLRFHLLGIRLECQVTIPTVGRVDFVVDGWLILEADGQENHDGVGLRHKDLVRDAAASALGYETLRFDYAQIVHDWASVSAAVIAALHRLRDRV